MSSSGSFFLLGFCQYIMCLKLNKIEKLGNINELIREINRCTLKIRRKQKRKIKEDSEKEEADKKYSPLPDTTISLSPVNKDL